MKHLARNIIGKTLVVLVVLVALMPALPIPHGSAHAQDRPSFSQQQLEQTLAPIALYPDSLLSQILMASTYPLEVVEAARWSRSHANLIGEDAVRAAENENWDPSVKSLLAFPQVLTRMDEDLQWLQALGDAFLGQEPQVMDAVQSLRRRAQVAGNLRSDERQRIVDTGPLLVVQPADPQIIYVPYYDTRVVYGRWWWPNHTPVHWRPFPGYRVWPGSASSFYWGPSIRISVGYFFGGFDWSRRHVRVVQSNYYYSAASNQRTTGINRDRPPGSWQHDPIHRRGVAYRGAEVPQRFADTETRPDTGSHLNSEGARQPDQRRAQSYPTANRRSDASRPAVQVGVQPLGSTKVQPAIQQLAQPDPTSSRQGELRNDVRRPAVQPARDIPEPPATRQAELHNDVHRPAVQPARDMSEPPATRQVAVTPTRFSANAGAERRDHAKDVDHGDRREPVESRHATPPANAVPQTQTNRGNERLSHSDQSERSARPHASKSNQESRSFPVTRQEAQRGVERHEQVQSKPEVRLDPGRQRGASAENALQRSNHPR